MATVTEDLKQGHSLVEDRGAFTLRRIFYVTGLVEAAPFQIMEALQDAGIPASGDAYPFGVPVEFPTYENLFVAQRRGEPYGTNAVRVVITYSNVSRISHGQKEPPLTNEGPDLKKFSTSFYEKKTTRDRLGAAMTLTPPASYSERNSYLSEAVLRIPAANLLFARTEKSPPSPEVRSLVGKVNAAVLNNWPARTLLLVDVDGESEDGVLWDVEYAFRYRGDTWDHTDVWKTQSGKVPTDAVEVTFETLETADFTTLGLDFSDAQGPL